VAVVTFDGTLPANLSAAAIGAPGDVVSGKKIIYAGYGKRSDASQEHNNPLQFLQTQIDLTDPQKKFSDTGGGKTHCNGDSGGPVYLNDVSDQLKLIGIISYGTSTSCENGVGFNADATRFQGWFKCAFGSLQKSLEKLTEDDSSADCGASSPGQSISGLDSVGQNPFPDQDQSPWPQDLWPGNDTISILPPGIRPDQVCVEHDSRGECIRFMQ